MPTVKSSSLHVEKTLPRGREINLSRSTFNNSVRDAIRRGAAEYEVQKMKRSLQALGDK